MPSEPAVDRSRLRLVRLRGRDVGWYVLLSLLSLVILFPVWLTIVRAISAPIPYLQARIPPYPVSTDLGVFRRAWTEGNLGRAIALSIAVTLAIVSCQLVTSVLAAYAFAHLRFPLRRTLFAVVFATLLLPIEVTLVVNARTIRDLGWLNSVQGLAAPFMATAFGIFLLRQAFRGIPPDVLDAARLEGYSHSRFLWRIAVPMCRPVVASFLLVSLLTAWNQYTWPRLTVTQTQWQTLQLRLATLSVQNPDQANIGFAAALIASVPVLVMLIVFQRQLIRGLTTGAVKG